MTSDTLKNGNSPERLRVLLVDDDEDAYILTRHHLSKIQGQGLQLDWASTYESGIEAIRKNEHDVYLLDYRLGARTGLELLQEALALGCKEPIIMLTAENPEVDAQAMKLGAADFLNKDRLDSVLLERSVRYSVKHYKTLRALRESEAQLASFMQNVPCAVYMKNLHGRYVYVNETCAKVFRRRFEDWIGKTDDDLWPRQTAAKFKSTDQQIVQEKRSIETTESVSHEDGTHYWLTSKFPILDEQGSPTMIGAAAIDITDIKRLEREIQQISEQEKRRIGQDLHDGLGQWLTGIACMVKTMEQKLANKGLPEANDAKTITKMVNETIAQARDLARGLCPVELETNGLQAALQELTTRVEKLFSVNCELKAPQFVRVYDNAAAIHLYRIAQEAINNSMKHGKAKKITVDLAAMNAQVILTVKDDGCGLPKGVGKARGMGLRVMNYRAGMIGANVTIESPPEGGTVVRCVVENENPAKLQSRPKTPKARRGSAPPAPLAEPVST
ncbi:MAG: multi-sensor signal transduction histidine kinase [Verrucomicrobiales bacterium]|jgi:PAS domain S-box-containing protein|nr:multi-sensor signal transduction histidine kinase [Verrucomicrobiales bacterium]